MTKYYNAQVNNTQFRIDDLVLQNNKASQADKISKRKAIWEGPYQVIEVLPEGN